MVIMVKPTKQAIREYQKRLMLEKRQTETNIDLMKTVQSDKSAVRAWFMFIVRSIPDYNEHKLIIDEGTGHFVWTYREVAICEEDDDLYNELVLYLKEVANGYHIREGVPVLEEVQNYFIRIAARETAEKFKDEVTNFNSFIEELMNKGVM